MTFRTASLLAATASILICLSLVFVPALIYWLFSIQGNEASDFIAKRAGVLFLGLSLMGFLARDTTSNETKRLVSVVIATVMGTLAVLGLFELFRGTAGLGILVAIVIELLFLVVFIRLWKHAKITL